MPSSTLWRTLALLLVVGCDVVLPLVEDAGQEAAPPGTTFICGDEGLACTLADPNIGCCVIAGMYDAVAPESYGYECVTPSQCAKDRHSDASYAQLELHCDNGSQCPGSNPQVCCWASTGFPTVTYCFAADASNCINELCDPNAHAPCVNHPGYACVPASTRIPLAPLGYHVCAPENG